MRDLSEKPKFVVVKKGNGKKDESLKTLIDDIFAGLDSVLNCSREARLVNASELWPRGCERLWRCIWENRHLLRIPEADLFLTETEALSRLAILGMHKTFSKLACDM